MKRAIRNKRKFSKQFSKDRKQLNLELKNKWRNEATKLRRKSIRSHWQKVKTRKSIRSHWQKVKTRKSIRSYWQKVCNNLSSNSKQFYNTFNRFLNHKKDACAGNNITLNINGRLETLLSYPSKHWNSDLIISPQKQTTLTVQTP